MVGSYLDLGPILSKGMPIYHFICHDVTLYGLKNIMK